MKGKQLMSKKKTNVDSVKASKERVQVRNPSEKQLSREELSKVVGGIGIRKTTGASTPY